nr:hypothetical protein TLHOJNLA_TLHOJNLA_CDS_0008 [Microvirus sp.]
MDAFNYFKEHLFVSLQSPIITSVVTDDLGNTSTSEVTPRYRDIHFLIHEKLLESLDPSSLSKFLEPLNNSSSSDDFALSDEQLTALCASRYVQQPTDVKQYADFLLSKADEIKSSFKKSEERSRAWADFVKSVSSSPSVSSNTSESNTDN